MANIDFSKMVEADIVVNHVNSRFKKGLNCNIFVIGLSGTGKSSTSLRVGEKIIESREIKPEIFIVDSLLELLRALRKTNEGDIIVIEEVSVLFPSRRAMVEENVSINKVLDTCRKKMITILSNAPLWGTIDSHMRGMGHILIETLRINRTLKVVISKFHRLQTNPLSGKCYRHTFQRNGIDVSRMFTRMPNKERWDNYEREKDKFMEELYKTLEYKQLKKKKKLEKETVVVQPEIKELSKRELQVHQFVNREGLTQTETATRLGVSIPRINQILKKIKKKTENPLEKRVFKVKNQPIPTIK